MISSQTAELPLHLFTSDTIESLSISVHPTTRLPLQIDEWVRVSLPNQPGFDVLAKAWPNSKPSDDSTDHTAWFAKMPMVVVPRGNEEVRRMTVERISPQKSTRVTLRISGFEFGKDSQEVDVFGFEFTKAHPLVKRKILEAHPATDKYQQFSHQTVIQLVDTDSEKSMVDSLPNSNARPNDPKPAEPPNIPIPTGLEKAFHELYDLVKLPLIHSDLVQRLNIEFPKGALLYGPPGVGKTMLVSTVAKYCNANLLVLNGSDVFGSRLGESEERVRAKFNEALEIARSKNGACILFIDEIVSRTDRLIVIAATNRPNAIDAALRRPGRFDREIAIDAPSETARLNILKSMAKDLREVGADVDFAALAVSTNGYVGADLVALCREAVMHCLDTGDGRSVSNSDFVHALSVTTPSTTRGYAVGIPSGLTWNSVGGLEDVKLKLQQCVEWPITRRETFLRLGLQPPRGVLLYGPPGCSKTTLVKIIACTSNATFLSINGASLYSPFVGDSEAQVRALFHRARLSAPSVIFLDEIDAIVGSRDLSGGGGGTRDPTQESVLSTLLNEMDGIEAAKDVLVVGATNRPDMIDAALMRPGRFDKVIYVPPPDASARLKILNLYSQGMPISSSIAFHEFAIRTEKYTGADLESVCREAAFAALRESKGAGEIDARHFENALKAVKPSLSDEMLQQYAVFSRKFGKGTK
ncbi:hypothetical protein HDU98_000802 [Podochytrium sp. JEL0797]|nr:hypothetical protein HDU98_000802 [Podochytrium sp. JEL0797]